MNVMGLVNQVLRVNAISKEVMENSKIVEADVKLAWLEQLPV